MSETIPTYQIDSIPANQLPDRYGIKRSAFYERVALLGLKFEKRSTTAIASADQVGLLDALHDHIRSGQTIESFVSSLPKSESQLATIAENPNQAIIALVSAIASMQLRDPLAHIEALQKACDMSWLLPSCDLAPLLKLKRLTGDSITRYGFKCDRVGRNGREWRIVKG